ncbi:UbiA family prenyltransferase [Pseudohongiella sp.]|uniref:UbiA family prenyltransferase n=1 Tax=marine sediment metagenome TaxID=412755 RepID=A0A0F9VSG4_9ZZZZ|nr:UbiA family prenyltransferase [Pseudohongiella sp.]HDZ10221.1 UbiA family prenyltransferase [Pseudohongiella sp.]HEA62237.1 UbiA family prenyltransferase [Pseudohongiella sp.]
MTQPLVVDLDGTLIHTDMLHESALKVLREQPWATLLIPVWLVRGKAVLKQHLADRSRFDPGSLPYNEELLTWLRQQKNAGRKLILCTASHQSIAHAIADHLQLFDEVMASDGTTNLSGLNKADALTARFAETGFVYVGNCDKDLPVWTVAHSAVVVNGVDGLSDKARAVCDIEHEFPLRPRGLLAWLHVIRAHQWLKNFLLFIPLIAAHKFGDLSTWFTLMLAFVAFSLCASAVYITNDLLDLESDRLHPRKRFRPFASGLIPAWQGVLLMPVLLAVGLATAFWVNVAFLQWLLVYLALTCAYSFGLKRLMLVDCLTLAMLYTLRIIAGTAAASLDLSFWLLAESVFLFLSLAFVKRYAELALQSQNGENRAHGRGYYTSDAPLIQTLGVTSGYVAVMVLALYLNSEEVLELYRNPTLVWAAIPFMLFWVSWMWMQASRGNMHDDPLVFAVKDKASLLAGLGFAVVLVIGSVA